MSFILYGSQTGQAKAIAETLFEVVNSKNNNFKLFELDEIDKSFSLAKLNVAVIICSTTGDGDPPENAAKFLRKIKLYPPNSLCQLKYTVLGLGDTNYSNYCYCAKMIDSVLFKIGAQRFYCSNWADDAVGLELVTEPWLEGLYKTLSVMNSSVDLIQLLEKVNICEDNVTTNVIEKKVVDEFVKELLGDIDAVDIHDRELSVPLAPSPFLHIDYSHRTDCLSNSLFSSASLPADKSGLCLVNLLKIERITAQYAIKSVHKMTLSNDNIDWTWFPGDSVGVLPRNSPWEVEQILNRLKVPEERRHCPISLSLLSTDSKLMKKNVKIPEHLVIPPTATASLSSVLSWLCDIRAPLSKAGLRIMAEYCGETVSERRRLLELCSKEGQMLYIKCIREPCLPILELLNWFPSCTIPVERLLEVLPRLKPRAYSLSDCHQITFAFSKVDIAPVPPYRKRPLTGVCTTWMEKFSNKDEEDETSVITMPIYLRKNLNGFTVTCPSAPHILIGPGTGVSPFISFLQYFDMLKKRGEEVGAIWLFFGCRERRKDFIFEQEMRGYLREGTLSHLCVAFSRDKAAVAEEGAPQEDFCVPPDCRYVQDCLLQHRDQLTSLVVDRGARIFVCGDSGGLSKDVLATWSTVLQSSMTKKEADSFIAKMRINKLYLEDVWL